jgi:hypothetical protein
MEKFHSHCCKRVFQCNLIRMSLSFFRFFPSPFYYTPILPVHDSEFMCCVSFKVTSTNVQQHHDAITRDLKLAIIPRVLNSTNARVIARSQGAPFISACMHVRQCLRTTHTGRHKTRELCDKSFRLLVRKRDKFLPLLLARSHLTLQPWRRGEL